jgi:hypothetical protein
VSRDPAERGQTVLDVLVAVAIALVALACVSAYVVSRTPGATAAARSALPAAVEQARTIAASSGGGATLALAPEPAKAGSRTRFDVVLYRYRPEPNSPFDRNRPERTWRLAGAFRASTGPGPVAVFISSSGTASFAAWSPGDPPLQNEPPCTAPLGLTVAGDAKLLAGAPPSPPPGPPDGVQWFSLDCSDARLVPE